MQPRWCQSVGSLKSEGLQHSVIYLQNKWRELPRCKADDEISIFSTPMVREKLAHLLVEQKRRPNAHPEC